jgi:transcriptional regulator with XRE-family HTH domain
MPDSVYHGLAMKPSTAGDWPAPKRLRSLSAVLGESLRRRRELRGLRQDDVAAVARAWGFDWSQATVAAYEMGRRDFSIEELSVLGYIAAQLAPADAVGDAKPVELADLLPNAGELVRLNDRAQLDASSLKPVLRGEAQGSHLSILTAPASGSRDDVRAMSDATGAENEAVTDRLWPHLRHQYSHDPDSEYQRVRVLLVAAHLDKLGDAEQKAARRLRTFPLAVTAAARKRWGRSFTEERDHRVVEQVAPNAEPRTVQALRGHVARVLIAELRQEDIEGLKPKRRKRR